MPKKTRPEPPIESPIPFRTGSNGEFVPRPRTRRDERAEALFHRTTDESARKLGVSRRELVESMLGTATALWVINQVYGCGDDSGNFAVGAGGGGGGGSPPMEECEALTGGEFIFDVQTHHVNPAGDWRQSEFGESFEIFLGSILPQGGCGETDAVDCYDVDHYLDEMFVNSDTTMAVLSAVPAPIGDNPLETEEQVATRELINAMGDSPRLVIHGAVQPQLGASQLEAMEALATTHAIAAWKVYTPYGGWRLDDEDIGIPFIEKAQLLGIKRICAHKGFPLPGFDPNFAHPDDIGVVAKAFPDMKFVVYHSAYELGITEGPYDPRAIAGIDTLVKTIEDNELGPEANVYGEIGSTWRALMTEPDQAAHALGKLLKYLGPDRVVWGTDSIWYGSPQDQIDAFRAFEIPVAMQDEFGYPPLCAETKKKILGLNSAALYGIDPQALRDTTSGDRFARRRAERQNGHPERRFASFRSVGPQTRRELFELLRRSGGQPG